MANTDFCHVEHRAIVVGVEIVAYMDILSEVAVKIVAYEGIAAHIAKQFFHDILFLGKSAKVRLFNCLTSSEALTISNSISSLIFVLLNDIFSINSVFTIYGYKGNIFLVKP